MTTTATPAALIDAAGKRIEPAPDARILSLVPSLTETLFSLDLGDNLVGRTAFCIHPKDRVKKVRSVGGTKRVNWRKVEAAEATHAVLNIDENPKEMADELARRDIQPIVTHPIEVADNGPLIRFLGTVFGKPAEADAMAREFETALAALAGLAGARDQARVLYLIWKDPWMTISRETYISRFLALIGWRTWPAESDARYPEIELTDGVLDQVDRVLLSSEPFPFSDEHLATFRDAFPAHAEKARLVDGELLSWYGVRARRGLDYLRDLAGDRA